MNLNYKFIWNLCEPYVCEKMNISKDVYYVYKHDVLQYRDFDSNIRYAGRGDSSNKNESLSSFLVPEINDLCNYIFYIHDNLYGCIKDGVLGINKYNSDLIMLYMLQCILGEDSYIPNIYYEFVRVFG